MAFLGQLQVDPGRDKKDQLAAAVVGQVLLVVAALASAARGSIPVGGISS